MRPKVAELIVKHLDVLTQLTSVAMSGRATISTWWEIAVQAGAILKLAREQASA